MVKLATLPPKSLNATQLAVSTEFASKNSIAQLQKTQIVKTAPACSVKTQSAQRTLIANLVAVMRTSALIMINASAAKFMTLKSFQPISTLYASAISVRTHLIITTTNGVNLSAVNTELAWNGVIASIATKLETSTFAITSLALATPIATQDAA